MARPVSSRGTALPERCLAAYQHLRAEAGPLDGPRVPDVQSGLADRLVLPMPYAICSSIGGDGLPRRGLGDDILAHGRPLYRVRLFRREPPARRCAVPIPAGPVSTSTVACPRTVMVEMMVAAARNGIRIGSFSPRILEISMSGSTARAPIDRPALADRARRRLYADEVKRVADLGLVLQAYSSKWIAQDGEALRAKMGDESAERILPLRDLIDAGFMYRWRPTTYHRRCSCRSTMRLAPDGCRQGTWSRPVCFASRSARLRQSGGRVAEFRGGCEGHDRGWPLRRSRDSVR